MDETEAEFELGLGVDPLTFKPVIVAIINDATDEPIRVALGDSKDALRVAEAITVVAIQSTILEDEIEMADPMTYEEAIQVANRFGQRINASNN